MRLIQIRWIGIAKRFYHNTGDAREVAEQILPLSAGADDGAMNRLKGRSHLSFAFPVAKPTAKGRRTLNEPIPIRFRQ